MANAQARPATPAPSALAPSPEKPSTPRLPLVVVTRDGAGAAPVVRPKTGKRRGLWIGLSFLINAALALGVAALLRPDLLPRRTAEPAPVAAPVVPAAAVGLGHLLPAGDIVRVGAPSGAGEARVERLHVAEGDQVKAGDVLAVLDSADRLEAALRTAETDVAIREAALAKAQNDVASLLDQNRAALSSAEAQAETARIELNRARTLFEKNITAQAVLDQKVLAARQADRAVEQARATLARYERQGGEQPDILLARREVEGARAAVERARAERDQAYIRAPANGRVLDLHVEAGERLGSAGLLDMGDTSRMAARIEIYETDIGRVDPGDPVVLTAPALPAPLHARVERVGLQVQRQSVIDADPAANTDARVVEVWATLDPASSQEAARFTNLQVRARVEP